MEEENICIQCRLSTGFCPWSKDFNVVEGWNAEKSTIYSGTKVIDTYHITKCPLFIEDYIKIKRYKLIRLLKLKRGLFSRYSDEYIKKVAELNGYQVRITTGISKGKTLKRYYIRKKTP